MDVDLNIHLKDLPIQNRKKNVTKLYQEMEFKNWLTELLNKILIHFQKRIQITP